ncbi:MAG: hypothetical protein IPP73_05265 [Chitinophagaceae bacterium]|nr:hypothetical protein [Chitinophagaceae bacterium]
MDLPKNGEIYDLIFDAVNTIPVLRSLRSLAKTGNDPECSRNERNAARAMGFKKTSKEK